MDLYLFNFINQYAEKWAWLDFSGIFFAEYSGYVLLFILALLFLFKPKNYWKMVLWSIISGILSRFVITNIIRFFWERQRPFDVMDVNLLLKLRDEASFPSGHAAFYFAISTVVYFYNKKLGFSFFTVSILMGLSRIFVGYHWPSDILAGAVIGIISGLIINKFSKK